MTFRVGDIVECLDASGISALYGLRTGGVYAVRDVDSEFVGLLGIGDSLTGWCHSRFRLIKPRATDITSLKKIVDDVFGKVPA